MQNDRLVLTCKKVKYYSRKDEDAFFEWIKKTTCIEKISAQYDELYLHVASIDLHEYDLRELPAIFCRYKIDMTQLSRFLNKSNEEWFFKNKRAYWHKKVFGKQIKNDTP